MASPMFLLMPQWQGSPSSRAMQLAEGADALREDLPKSALTEIAVPLEAGDAMGTPVARLSSLLRAREAARTALEPILVEGRPPIIVGGDCASSLPGIEAAVRTTGKLAVLWFDAHADLQHPSTSPSGAASGMTLRHALGEGSPDLLAEPALDPGALTLVGTRALDPEEVIDLERLEIDIVRATVSSPAAAASTDAAGAGTDAAGASASTDALHRAILDRISGADGLYIHIDLDVLDPSEFSSVHAPEPFGLSIAALTGAIRAAVAAVPLAGAAICEFAPADAHRAAEDLPTVLRILAALTSGSRAAEASDTGASE
ncbi:arginase family protein [Leucobacter sp. NPDC058333]|uniref:arginase family protein n=1 Tax=Leucobacter sp. NPDC058333 TaxID=3346450 RepID=UPI0036568690